MRLPNPYSLEETLEKLRHRLAAACNEDALTLLEKAVTKAHDDEAYAKHFEETLLQDPPSRSASVSAALVTTLSDPETRRPITRITMPSTALMVHSTPSCSMRLSQHRAGARITPAFPNPIIRSNTKIRIFRSPTRPPHYRWPFLHSRSHPHVCFHDRSQGLPCLCRSVTPFCNAPCHRTTPLSCCALWWNSPMDVTSTWTWRVDRLVRLMMLANRRAVWHRYQLGRQQEQKEPRQHCSTKLGQIKPAHSYHQAPLTDSELVAPTNSPAAPCTNRVNGAGALSRHLGL